MDSFGFFGVFTVLGALFGVVFAILFAVVGFALVVFAYVLFAVGVSSLAARRGLHEKQWMAWVPVAQFYLIGLIKPEVELFGQKLTPMCLILPLSTLAILLGNIPIIGGLFPIAAYSLSAITAFQIMREITSVNTLLYAIFWPIGYFLIRNK